MTSDTATSGPAGGQQKAGRAARAIRRRTPDHIEVTQASQV